MERAPCDRILPPRHIGFSPVLMVVARVMQGF